MEEFMTLKWGQNFTDGKFQKTYLHIHEEKAHVLDTNINLA